jgi:hypothetical protein
VRMTVFWDVAPCSLVEVYRRFRNACYLHHQDDPDDWGSKYLWNVAEFLPDYTVQHPEDSYKHTITKPKFVFENNKYNLMNLLEKDR